MGGENPHFPCDHLLDPKVNEAEILTCRNILFALSLTFFFLPPPLQIWEWFHILRYHFIVRLKL